MGRLFFFVQKLCSDFFCTGFGYPWPVTSGKKACRDFFCTNPCAAIFFAQILVQRFFLHKLFLCSVFCSIFEQRFLHKFLCSIFVQKFLCGVFLYEFSCVFLHKYLCNVFWHTFERDCYWEGLHTNVYTFFCRIFVQPFGLHKNLCNFFSAQIFVQYFCADLSAQLLHKKKA